MILNYKNVLVLSVTFFLCTLNSYSVAQDYEGSGTMTQEFQFPRNRGGILMTRIIGGSVTAEHQYPFQVALVVWIGTDAYFCGGSLISRTWVLTAAHCLEGVEVAQVTLGAYNLSAAESSQVVINSTSFIIHEEWAESTLQNDLGLIKLPYSVSLNSYISTVSIADGNESYVNETGTVLGWGLTALGTMSSVLRHVNTTIMSNEACAAIDPYQTVIVDSHICTSGDGIIGSCSGDSGGPLLVGGIQVGIVSFGYSSCTVGKPSVYARVTDYYDWITSNAVENSTDSEGDEYFVSDDEDDGDKSNSGFRFKSRTIMFVLCSLFFLGYNSLM